MADTVIRSVRVLPEDWETFRRLQFTLEQQLLPAGRLSQADVFKICVNSLGDALDSGRLHRMHGLQPPPRPPDKS